MPIQEEEKAPGTPAAKAGPLFKTSSTSGWDPSFKGQGQWIGIDVQESKGPYCFEVSKFITRLLRQSQRVFREDGEVHYDQVIVECKKKPPDNTRYWSDEVNKHFVNAPHWSI